MFRTPLPVSPRQAGKYNHYNDKYMRQNTSTYVPPSFNPDESANRDSYGNWRYPDLTPPQAPRVIVQEQSDGWFWFNMGRLWESLVQPRSRTAPTVIYQEQRSTSRSSGHRANNQEEANDASLLGAIIFFIAALGISIMAMAYALKDLYKISEDILANRKSVANLLRLGTATFFAFIGARIGIIYGAYYGIPLFASGPMGALLGASALAFAGLGVGIFVGKHFARLCTWLYTRGERTNTDPYSLRTSTEQAIEKHFSSKSNYAISRPHLMLNYLLNKIEIARENKASQGWLDTLEGYKKALKQGKYPEALKSYFDNEWLLLRQEWYRQKSTVSPDWRFTNTELEPVKNDFIALSLITCQETTMVQDFARFDPIATASVGMSYGAPDSANPPPTFAPSAPPAPSVDSWNTAANEGLDPTFEPRENINSQRLYPELRQSNSAGTYHAYQSYLQQQASSFRERSALYNTSTMGPALKTERPSF